MTFTPLDDSPFGVRSMDLATMWGDKPVGEVMVTGNFEGGGGRREVISTTSTFTTYDVFTDGSVFDNVVVESRISGAIGAEPGFAIDNINLTPVPEPASMVALGLGAVALMRRRKKTA